jgi:hypothetical protein
MRALLLCLAVLCGCDGSIRRTGIVIDAQSRKPIEGAQIWFADRVYNDQMKTYLDNKSTTLERPNATTTADGKFEVRERLAGPGGHDVWMVVRKPGYTEDRRSIWKGTGLKAGDPEPIEVALVLDGNGKDPAPN